MKNPELFVDVFTASTAHETSTGEIEICCPNCGSWTTLDDIKQDQFTGESSCSLCR